MFGRALLVSAWGALALAAPDRCSEATCAQVEEDDSALLQVAREAEAGRPFFGFDDDEQVEDDTPSRGSSFGSGGVGSLCGIGDLVAYPGYRGGLRVGGKMWMRSVGSANSAMAGQALSFRLLGVDPACAKGPGAAPNSCGVQIHEGGSCARPTGDSLWDAKLLRQNPWSSSTYTSFQRSDGTVVAGAKEEIVRTGHLGDVIRGRTVVVHDFQGQRIACAPISGFFHGKAPDTELLPGLEVERFAALSRWGRVDIEGSVALNGKPGPTKATTGVYVSYRLTGVDARCSDGPGPAPNSCGIRLQTGTSCMAPGGSYYNTEALLQDPWAAVSYVSADTRQGMTAASAPVGVNTGLTMEEIAGHVLVVYDFNGAPVVCGTAA